MGIDTASISPTKGTICNLATGEAMDFMLNPTNFKETVDVNYKRVEVPGLSHQRLNYVSTGNAQVPLEFYLDKFFANRVFEEDRDIQDFKRFLQALTVPSGGAETVSDGAPPRALVIWPGVLSLSLVVTRLEFECRQFDFLGGVLVYTASVKFEEARAVRITSQEIRQAGSLRGTA